MDDGARREHPANGRQHLVTEVGVGARQLLAGKPGEGDSPTQVAERATDACERLARHLSRLLGDLGVQMLFNRSVIIASAQFPWLHATATSAQVPGALAPALRPVMEQQDSETIVDAFVAILTTLVGLLKRLIGDALVERVLHEVWPAVFVREVKDTP